MPGPSEMERAVVESSELIQAQQDPDAFRRELESLINQHSGENGSNTPDWILASFLANMLLVFDGAVMERERWYGRQNGDPGDWLIDVRKPRQTRPIPRPLILGDD